MEKFDYIEDVILTVDEGAVARQGRPVVLPAVLLLVGVVVAYLGTRGKDAEGDMVSSLLLVAGLVVVVAGIVLWMVKKGRYVHRPSGRGMKRFKIYIAPEQSFRLQQVLQERAYEQLGALRQPHESNLSVEVFLADDHEYALLQALEFIPYNDVPTTGVVVCRGAEARALAASVVA
jgi:hypothetical protein